MKLEDLTLREKIGQTGILGPTSVRDGAKVTGDYFEYFRKNPYGGIHLTIFKKENGEPFSSPQEQAELLKKLSEDAKLPYLITGDFEFGARDMFPELHTITTNMSLGACDDPELIRKRGYYFGRELLISGVNWVFGPVFDLQKNFFCPTGVRAISDKTETIIEKIPPMLQGLRDAGIASTAKHYPGGGNDYRDSHFSAVIPEDIDFDEWEKNEGKIWKAAIDSGVDTIMIGHSACPQFGKEFARGRNPRPATASKKAVGYLRDNLGFDGVIVTDAVGMKSLASAFDHDDIYIECFNAGCDVILFVHEDYIDVMEKAVLDGRISMERLDEAVERVLKLKKDLGLLDGVKIYPPLTDEEKADFDRVNYEIAQKALTPVANYNNIIPFDPKKVKKAAIINLSPVQDFIDSLPVMAERFKEKGIEADVFHRLENKQQAEDTARDYDIIIYACYLAQGRPQGMSFYSAHNDIISLLHVNSYGAEKSVGVSFGAPSIYYNYFENADGFINAYSYDKSTMQAVVDAILGEFEMTAKSPVALKPEFK